MRVQCQAALGAPVQYPGEKLVFPGLHALRQRFFTVVRQHRNAGPGNRRAAIKLLGDKVHGAAMLGVAGFQCATMGVQALVPWQQGGVDVEQAALIVTYKGRCQDAHEAGQHHEVRRVAVDFLCQCAVEGGAIRVLRMVDHRGGDAVLARIGEATSVRAIADDPADAGSRQGRHDLRGKLRRDRDGRRQWT